jgi:hypothetical protein
MLHIFADIDNLSVRTTISAPRTYHLPEFEKGSFLSQYCLLS